jgi:hypothetical protein
VESVEIIEPDLESVSVELEPVHRRIRTRYSKTQMGFRRIWHFRRVRWVRCNKMRSRVPQYQMARNELKTEMSVSE